MCITINPKYLYPQLKGLSYHLDTVVDEKILHQITPNEKNCIISSYLEGVFIRDVFYYSSYFHSGSKAKYGVEVAPQPDFCRSNLIVDTRTQNLKTD